MTMQNVCPETLLFYQETQAQANDFCHRKFLSGENDWVSEHCPFPNQDHYHSYRTSKVNKSKPWKQAALDGDIKRGMQRAQDRSIFYAGVHKVKEVDSVASPPIPTPAEVTCESKIRYPNKETARGALLDAQDKGRGETQFYHCSVCGKYHLSSLPISNIEADKWKAEADKWKAEAEVQRAKAETILAKLEELITSIK